MPQTAYVQANGGSATEARQLDERPSAAAVAHVNGGAGTGPSPRNDSPDTSSVHRDRWSVAPRPRMPAPEVVAFRRLEQREGVVLDVDEPEGIFRARLVDPRAQEPDQEVEVEIQQVSPSDLDLLASGAHFFWAIGYVTRRSGRRNLVLQLDFRRLPRLGRDLEERARLAGDRYVEEMNWT
jgi:hypothetical protein